MTGQRPGWLYDGACCGQWTPEDGCTRRCPHTGRPAMSLAARELGTEAESARAAARRAAAHEVSPDWSPAIPRRRPR
jgi:hypothetical protein